MTYWPETRIKSADSPSVDAFGRWRTSNPFTIFDSTQTFTSESFLWNTSGSIGTAASFSTNEASTTLSVLDSTDGKIVRQTFRRFYYQPAKSQEIIISFSGVNGFSGIIKRVGYFDENNGIFLESSGSNINFVRRSNVTGTPVDTKVSQSAWNVDKMDGSGESKIELDFSKTQILQIDLEWLGVGRVRCGFNVDGQSYCVHQFLNTNILSTVYMSTPVLPLRYEISNDGSGPASDITQICASVMSEGGREKIGIIRHRHHLGLGTLNVGAFTHTALMGIRLNPTTPGAAELVSVSLAATTNDEAHWMIVLNPTVTGSFDYINQPNSLVQIATGSVSNIVTGGTHLDGGFFSQASPKTELLKSEVELGMSIDGTPQEFVVTLIQLTANLNPYVNIEWREL